MQEGCLKKLTYQVQSDGKVVYDLNLNSEKIPINDLLGKKISLTNLNQINCVHCGKKTKKSFSQGHCYPCFRNLAYTDLCQVRPETCHFHLGTCRDDSWAQKTALLSILSTLLYRQA